MPTTKPDYNKNYYANHKDVMKAQIKVSSDKLVDCMACKKHIKKGSMAAHKLTKMHKYITSQTVAVVV